MKSSVKKTQLILATILWITNSFFIYAQPNLDEDFIWNEISFNTPLDSLKNLKFIKKTQELDLYEHTHELTNFEGITIRQVRYYFWEKHLHSIIIKTEENAEQAEMLLAWLSLMLGEGEQLGFAPRYSWKGKSIKVTYDKNIITHQVEWKILHLPTETNYLKYVKRMN